MCEKDFKISLGTGSLEFSSDGLKCSTIIPSVSFKTGNEEKLIVLDFREVPSIKQANINTYYGGAKETTFTWKYQTGFSFSWSVAVMEKLNHCFVREILLIGYFQRLAMIPGLEI